MEMMTMSATSTDLFNVSVDEHGSVNYNFTTSSKNALAAALINGATATQSTAIASSFIFEMPIPYVYVIEKKSDADTIPVYEKIQKVLSFYNLGKSHLCKIIGISRTTLYAWIDESSEPDTENFAKVEQLYSVAKELDGTDGKSIYHGFIDKALPNEQKSLYQMFIENKHLETEEIKKLIKVALEKSDSRTKNINDRKKSEFVIVHSDAEKELNFEGNL